MSAAPRPWRVAIIDDDAQFARDLEKLLSHDQSLQVVARINDPRQVEAWLEGQAREVQNQAESDVAAEAAEAWLEGADLALVDLDMPHLSGIEVCRRIGRQKPQVKCLILTALERPDLLARAFAAGAVGYLTKDMSGADISRQIHRALGGAHPLSETATEWMVRGAFGRLFAAEAQGGANSEAGATGVAGGSPGEQGPGQSLAQTLAALPPLKQEIARLIVKAMPYRQIAAELSLAEITVRRYASDIFRQFGVSSRQELTIVWLAGR